MINFSVLPINIDEFCRVTIYQKCETFDNLIGNSQPYYVTSKNNKYICNFAYVKYFATHIFTSFSSRVKFAEAPLMASSK